MSNWSPAFTPSPTLLVSFHTLPVTGDSIGVTVLLPGVDVVLLGGPQRRAGDDVQHAHDAVARLGRVDHLVVGVAAGGADGQAALAHLGGEVVAPGAGLGGVGGCGLLAAVAGGGVGRFPAL